MIRIKLFIFFILITGGVLFSNEINWITNTEEAFNLAKSENKSVYVLITAPSWCHWCKKLEEDVLTDRKVIEYLNSNYIPLMLVDRIDGKPNPELSNFLFEGYPTQFVFDKDWGRVVKFSSFDSDEFISILEENRGKIGAPEPRLPDTYKIDGKLLTRDKNSFIFNNDSYKLITRDLRFFYIVNSGEDKILFIPYDGGQVLVREFDSKINDWGSIKEYGIGEK